MILGYFAYFGYLGVFVGAVVLYQLLFLLLGSCRNVSFKGQHIYISGGTQGLGKELAGLLVKEGANLTIVARKKPGLEATKKWLLELNPEARVHIVPTDVTDTKQVEASVASANNELGAIDVVIPCAGCAQLGYFTKMDISVHRKQMDLNYFGVLEVLEAIVPSMMERKKGRLILVSSAMAYCAYLGNSAYAPTKFALRGLSDALRNELLPYNITVQQAHPPNFKSPGFENEEKMKPPEQKAIEEGEPVYEAIDVAKALLNSVKRGDYTAACGDLGVNLLIRGSLGLAPRNNTCADIFLLPIVAIVGKVYSYLWDSAVLKTSAKLKKTQ